MNEVAAASTDMNADSRAAGCLQHYSNILVLDFSSYSAALSLILMSLEELGQSRASNSVSGKL